MTTPIPGHGAPDDDRITDCAACQDHLHELALGILPAPHATAMARHIADCAPCRAEYANMRGVTRLLPFLAEPADPSPDVKDRLMARIERASQTGATPPIALRNPWVTPDEPPAENPAPASNSASIWQRWIMPGVIAPLAICLIVLAAWTNSLRHEVNDLREAGNPAIAAASVASMSPYDLQLYEFRPACDNCAQNQASGKFGGNPNGNIGVVVAWNLDPDETHQVWCVNHQGEKFLVTDLDVEGGNVFQTVSFPEALGGYQQIYVARHDGTEEPDAELLVAMTDEHPSDPPVSTPHPLEGD